MVFGTIFGLLSALSWSVANATIGGASRRFGTWGALFGAQLVGSAVAVPAALVYEGVPSVPDASVLLMIAVSAAAALLAYGGLFAALRRGQVAVVSPIVSGWTLISVGIAVVWFGETLTVGRGAGVILVILGNALLAVFGAARRGSTSGTGRGALGAAVLSAVGFGVMTPAVAVVSRSIGLWTIPAVWAVELAVAIPVALRLGLIRSWPRAVADWRPLLAPGAFEAIGFIAILLGLALAPLAVVTPASSLSTGLSVLWGLWLLRERLRTPALVGAALAVAGVVVVNL